MRVVERTVRDVAPGIYEIALTVMAPARDDFGEPEGGFGGGPGVVYALLSGSSGPYPLPSGPLYWDRTGDDLLIPVLATAGPFDFVSSGQPHPPHRGIEVTDDGIINAELVASACGVVAGGPYTVIWRILLNGVTVAEESIVTKSGLFFFGSWGPTVSVTDLAVSTGDVLSGTITCHPSAMHMFRSPWGVNPGVNNNRLEITGGTFPP